MLNRGFRLAFGHVCARFSGGGVPARYAALHKTQPRLHIFVLIKIVFKCAFWCRRDFVSDQAQVQTPPKVCTRCSTPLGLAANAMHTHEDPTCIKQLPPACATCRLIALHHQAAAKSQQNPEHTCCSQHNTCKMQTLYQQQQLPAHSSAPLCCRPNHNHAIYAAAATCSTPSCCPGSQHQQKQQQHHHHKTAAAVTCRRPSHW